MKTVDIKDIIIFENKDYLLVNKPPYLSSLDDRDQTALSLKDMVKDQYPDASLGHRLDKETSGVLAIALHSEAYRNLAIQFENRQVEKAYHAVSEGLHEFDNLIIDQPLLKMANGIVKVDRQGGKEAMTIVNTLKAYKRHSLLECKPVSGRLHQIRVHLAYAHASITGDTQYGGHHLYLSDIKKHYNLKKDTEEQPLMKRVALHAFSLKFKGMNGESISVEAPYPKDFSVLVKQLEKFC